MLQFIGGQTPAFNGSILFPASNLHHKLESMPWTAVSAVFAPRWTWATLWTTALLLVVLLNFKVMPLVYHLRILNAVRFVLRSQRPQPDISPAHLFHPLVTSSRTCLLETDVYGHKSNSTYFADIDVARAHLVATLFGKAVDQIRGGTTMNGLSGKPHSNFTAALGAVSCVFRRPLLPYESYDMWTRVLSWDEKWVYLVTHFVKKAHTEVQPRHSSLYPFQVARSTSHSAVSDPKQGPPTSAIAASALSKVVFKKGRITVTPTDMLKMSGLLPIPRAPETVANSDATPTRVQQLADEIETERQRGWHMASLLAQQAALQDEFTSEIALGRHYDGFGVEGVLSTLAQLAKVSPFQLI